MSDETKAAGFFASDAFWSDPSPVALAPDGARKSEVSGVPDNHLLFATSGTSGARKWIAISKTALLASAHAVNEHLSVFPASVWGLALPMHHVGGFGILARARAASCALEIFPQSWEARAFASWLAGRRVTHTSLVPTQIHDLVAASCEAPAGLLAVVVGGGRLDVATGRAARALGWPVLASYGMTESASQIATQPFAALEHPYAPSPIPVLAHWQVRTEGQDCLEINGPALFSGRVIKGIYQPRVGDWFATSDRISITAEGLIPLGRADSLVKIAGELVDPLEVESRFAAALAGHGGCIAVVPVPDPRLGQRLTVVAERSVSTAALATALALHNSMVPRSQRLGAPIFIDKMPRGDLGKIQTSRLIEMAGDFPPRLLNLERAMSRR